jgi:hypothetical protein
LRRHRAPAFPERARRLATDLPVVWLQLVTPRQWRRHLPPLSAGWDRFAAGAAAGGAARGGSWVDVSNRLRNVREFVASIAPAERAFYFGHLGLPHAPWEYLPSGQTYACKPECYAVPIEGDGWETAQLLQRHLLQVGFADALLGDIIARLRWAGFYDRALLVVLSDHGAAFRTGLWRRALTPATTAEILAVPLLVKRPGQRRGTVSDQLVSTVDLLATVADVLAVRPPWPFPGRSWFAGGRGDLTYLAGKRVLPVPGDLAGQRAEATTRLARWAPTSDLWRIGPWPALHGRQLTPPIPDAATPRLELDRPHRFRDVDLRARPLPLSISGSVHGAKRGDGCCTLAFALNGTIWATTHSYWNADGGHRVAALVPPQALRAGDNEVTAYLIDEHGALRRLPPHR